MIAGCFVKPLLLIRVEWRGCYSDGSKRINLGCTWGYAPNIMKQG